VRRPRLPEDTAYFWAETVCGQEMWKRIYQSMEARCSWTKYTL
jgi:hypothetical protein